MANEGSAMSLLSGIGETVIDALAERGGVGGAILGGTLQRAVNTQGYQDKLNQEQFKRDQIAEYNANAPKRAMEQQEYIDNAPTRKAQAMFYQQKAEQDYKNTEMGKIKKGVFNEIAAQYPEYSILPLEEQEKIQKDPTMQGLYDNYYYTREATNGNWGTVEKWIKDNGGELTTNDKGERIANYQGRTHALTKENALALNQELKKRAMVEVEANVMLSPSVNSGNPAGRIFSEHANEMIKYTGLQPSHASKETAELWKSIDEPTRYAMIASKALDMYNSNGVTSADKAKGLQQLMMIAPKLGYKIDAPDGDPLTAKAITTDGRALNYMQFAEELKQKAVPGVERLNNSLMAAREVSDAKQRKAIAGSFGEESAKEQSPMEQEYKRLDKGAEDLAKVAPALVDEIQSGIDKYNKKNPKKMIDIQTIKRVTGTAHIEAEMKSGGDIAAYKDALADNLQEELSGYGITIDRNKNWGFDEKMHNFKIEQNSEKKSANKKRLAEAEKEADTPDEYSDNPFSIYQSPMTPVTTTDKSKKIALLQSKNAAIDNDTAERKKKLLWMKEQKTQQEKVNTEAAEKKKKFNSAMGL